MNPSSSAKFPLTHIAAIVAALCALLALISGALATTATTLTPPVSSEIVSTGGHAHTGEYLGVVLILMLILTALKESGVRVLALALAAMVLLEGFPGPQAVPGAANAMGLLHAVLAQVLLAGTVAVAILTAPSWKRPPEHVGDYGWPSLRSLAVLLPVLVLTQVVLGAGFRQRISGLMPHIIGAMLVALLILIVCAFTLQQCPTHTILRAAAKTLMVATFAQIFLGIAAYTVRAIGPNADANAVLAFTGGHVAVGALTLAASIVLSMQIRRNVLPKYRAGCHPARRLARKRGW